MAGRAHEGEPGEQDLVTYDRLFPAETVVVNRPHSGGGDVTRAFQADFLSGLALPLASSQTVVCSKIMTSPQSLDLLKDSGFPVPAKIIGYADEREFYGALRSAHSRGSAIASQYHLPVDETPGVTFRVDMEVLAAINNKSWLKEIVEDRFLPARRVMNSAELASFLGRCTGSWVLKAGGVGLDSGGGLGVKIHRHGPKCPGRVAAPQWTRRCLEYVQEEYLDLAASWAIQFTVDVGGTVSFLGASRQETAPDGTFMGGVIGAEQPPDELVEGCRLSVSRVAEMGYRGYCGLDAGVTADGRLTIFDPNFRQNGSTTALVASLAGLGTGRFGLTWNWNIQNLDLTAERLRSWVSAGRFTFLAASTPGPPSSQTQKPWGLLSGVLWSDRREKLIDLRKEVSALISGTDSR